MSSSIKLGSFSIFLILLIVLVISVVFSNSIPEGFITYNYAGDTTLQKIIILPYSKTSTVYHMYDSVYFDDNNGTIIEFFGKQYDVLQPSQTNNNLTDMFVMPRVGSAVKHYLLQSDVDTKNDAVYPNDTSPNPNSWVFPSADVNKQISSFQYQIVYIPWGVKDTVLFIYDITLNKIVSSYLFSNNIPTAISNMNQDIFRTSNLKYKSDSDSLNNSYVAESLYDPTKSLDVFQISSYVLFDTKNGYLIIRNGGKINIYNASGNDVSGKIKDTPTTISNTNSFVLNDVDGQNIVVYIPMGSTKTMVIVLTVDQNDSKLFMIRNVVRFDPSVSNGIYGKPNINKSSTSATSTSSTSATSKMDFANLSLNDVISKYYQQYYGSSSSGGNVPGAYSNDFLLKTQIIPPVCPSCPSCPSNVSCTNCGGTGGAGVVGATQYKDSFGNVIRYDASKNPIFVDKNGNLITTIFDSSGNQVQYINGRFIPIPPTSSDRNVSSAAPVTSPNTNFGGTVSSLGSSASNFGGDVVKGAENVVGTVAGLAGSTIGTAGSIVNNAISTVGKLGTNQNGSNDNKMYQNSRGQMGNYNGDNTGGSIGQSLVAPKGNYITTGADPSTYYGAVPDRGSTNFMPITSDFSKFGR